MSDKYPTAGLKPCPFCGQDVHPDYDFPQYVIHQTNKKGFNHSRLFMNRNDWNIRPIEDRLKARIAELEADVDQLIETGNKLGTSQFGWNDERDDWNALVKKINGGQSRCQ